MKRPPFVCVSGEPHLVINFDLAPDELPSLPALLMRLLSHWAADEILLLRPLTTAERQTFVEAAENADRETWARIVVREDDRYGKSDK